MRMEPVQVSAQWSPDGRFEPDEFTLDRQSYWVESTGRDWEDEQGYHVLCMVDGGQVFELVFRLSPAGWWAGRPGGGSQVA